MNIEIDNNSGFCFGVVYAIKKAEKLLKKNNELLCLGDIVHNDAEVKRLNQKGLKIIDYKQFNKITNSQIMFRAHGEHPNSYQKAEQNNNVIIDASCPIVLKLQISIRKKYLEIKERNGQIVIFGKKGHAEVIGLCGQTNDSAIVVSNQDDLSLIDYSRPIAVFSQTTKSSSHYKKILKEIEKRLKTDDFYYLDSVCKQVSNRDKDLKIFCKNKDLIIFMSGKKSSNGRMLFEVCKNENPNTMFVSNVNEIKTEWFNNIKNVGITGATSTPSWLMNDAKTYIEKHIIPKID